MIHPPFRIVLDQAHVTLAGRPALSGVSFTVTAGECWLVLGANGSGKSTLLRLLRGDIWPDDDGRDSRLYQDGDGPGRASPIGLRPRFGMVSPELQRSTKRLCGHLPAARVILAGPRDALYVQGRPSRAEYDALDATLARLGIEHLRDTPVEALSNGQLRAVLLARALVGKPLALFLDEFLDGLDSEAQASAAKAVSLAAADGAAVVVTSHQGSPLPPGREHNGVTLAAGHIVDQGPADAVLGRYRQCQEVAATADGPARPVPPPAASPAQDAPLVVLEHASVFLSRREILHDICLTVRPGGHMALLGANGAGKSSLLRLMAGEYHPALGGRALRPGLAAPEGYTDLRDIRKRIGLVSFELEADYDKELPAHELVLSGLASSIGLYAEPTPREREAAERWMAFFGVADLADKRLGQLSAGQTRRLFLARAMVAEPRLLLLDEPFSGLDTASRRTAMAAVSAAARWGTTIVTAVHSRTDIVPEITSLLRVTKGRISPLTADDAV